MPKIKEERIKAEKNKPKASSSQPAAIKKYIIDSGMEESSNQPCSQQPHTVQKHSGLSVGYLKTRDFVEIEGLQFTEQGEPIYHTVFIRKGNDMRESLKCSKEQIESIEDFLGINVSYEYLKDLLLLTRNEEEEREKMIIQKPNRNCSEE